MTVKLRLKALRKRLGLTQEAMAAKGGLGRVEVVRVEGGINDASTYRMRAGLAKAAELGVEDLAAYLDGEIDLEEALRRRRGIEPTSARARAAELAREDGVHEAAIQAILEEAIAPEHAHRSRLWWADRIRYRAHEMLGAQRSAAPPTPGRGEPTHEGTIKKSRARRA